MLKARWLSPPIERSFGMIWTAWNNGKHHSSGAGYDLKVPVEDRDRHFKRSFGTVFINLQGNGIWITVEFNINKASFWSQECRELINKKFGKWMIKIGLAPWPSRKPPKFEVEETEERHFTLRRLPNC